MPMRLDADDKQVEQRKKVAEPDGTSGSQYPGISPACDLTYAAGVIATDGYGADSNRR